MTGVAIDLLRQVTEAGGTVRLQGDALRLLASEPLPDDLRARVRQHKAEIVALLSAAEPANHMSLEGPTVCNVAGLPREISEGVHAILSADRAQGIPPQHWTRVRRDTARLVEGGWLERAVSLEWTTADLFGCDQRAPWHRLDRAGLVLLTGGHEVVDLDADAAAIRTSTGSILRFRRRPVATPPVALLWDLLIPARATGPPVRALTADLSKERMAAEVLGGTPPPS